MEPRNRLDRALIFDTAAILCEEAGLDNLTLKQLAGRLKVKTPSLYNHINGLKDIYSGLAVLGLQRLGTIIGNAAIGKSNDDAIIAIALEYRKFAKENPELYKAIMKSPELHIGNVQEAQNIVSLILQKVLEPCHYSEEDTYHMIRSLRSAVHGFVSLEAAGFFKNKYDIDASYEKLITIFLAGMKTSSSE